MWWLAACSDPDPDALIRAHDLEGASKAWEAAHGQPLDIRYPAADILSRRAASDPSITAQVVHDTVEAMKILDAIPPAGVGNVDLPFDRVSDLASCTPSMLASPWLVVVGRSDTPKDPDPYEGGPLQWKKGRLVGFASTPEALATLYAEVDRNPSPRLTTIALQGGGSTVYLFLGRRDGGWTLATATDPTLATRYLLECKTPPPP